MPDRKPNMAMNDIRLDMLDAADAEECIEDTPTSDELAEADAKRQRLWEQTQRLILVTVPPSDDIRDETTNAKD